MEARTQARPAYTRSDGLRAPSADPGHGAQAVGRVPRNVQGGQPVSAPKNNSKTETYMPQLTKKPLTHDNAGRPYAKLSELRPGDVLETDCDFTCIRKGARLTVWQTPQGRLAVLCRSHGHYLDGQADDGEHVVGFYKID